MKRALWAAAAIAVAALAAYLSIPSLVRGAAEEEAGRLGFKVKIGTARLVPWKILLGDVVATRGQTTAKVRKVEVELEGWMRPREVRVEGAVVDIVEEAGGGERKGGGDGRPLKMTVTDSEVRWRGGSSSATAKVRKAERDTEGRVSAIADVEAMTPWGKVRVKGLEARKARIGEPLAVKAESVRVEGEDPKAGGGGAVGKKRGLPKVTLDVGTATFTYRGTTTELTKARLSHESGSLDVLAERASLLGVAEAESLHASVTRTADGASFSASAGVLETKAERLSKAEFSAKSVGMSGTVQVSEGAASIPSAVFKLGSAEVRVASSYDPHRFAVAAEMSEVGCQELLESIPAELVPKLVPGTVLGGTAAWKIEVTVDLPERRHPSVSIWMKNRCTVQKVPEALRAERLRRPFKREVYTADGKMREVLSGPGTESWVSSKSISAFLPAAIRTMEDPGFLAHRGFLIQAFENSLAQNITAGRFIRGGSTITMQLAKNLWLAREKTLSRKMQEAVLTILLEKALSKQEILEYYMNCVEFGPDVYGVKAAAAKYFSKSPSALSLSQSLFLASILPNPRKSQFGADGKLGTGRLSLIRKMMGNMLERSLITQAQYDAGLKEVPVLGEPSSGADEEVVIEEGGVDPSEWR